MSHSRARESERERRFDRLVDGELSEFEYRALLAALDEEPDGWRQCALAFLEAQAWGQALGNLRDRALLEARARVERREGTNNGWRRWVTPLATAATMALAFGLGWVARSPAPAAAPAPQVVDNTTAAPTPVVARNDGGEQRESVAVGTEDSSPAMGPLGNVTLVVNSEDGTTRELELPVYPLEARYTNWLMNGDPGVPPEVQRALRNLGYQVRRDRRVAPVDTSGNQRLFVPMERVEITPVVSRTYQ